MRAIACKRGFLPWRGVCAAVASLACLGLPSPAGAADEAAQRETAECVAVMQTVADDLARRIKAGDRSQEPALRRQLERAAALIGRTYLDGFHDAGEAKARLKAAQERQAGWDEARRSSVHQACLKKADAELATASGPERFVVERLAQARFKRMLEQH